MKRGFATLRVVALLALTVLVGASAALAQATDAARKTGNAITDSWITMKVHAQFVPEDVLEGSDIDVDTNAGVVVLKGTVPTDAAKARAIAIAKATDGVKSVNDQLRIGPAEGMMDSRPAREAGQATKETAGTAGRAVTDGWIKSKLYAQIMTEDVLDDSELDIDVVKGSVTLNGSVKTAAARERAATIAKGIDGVKGVKNNLKVVPKGN